jgi:hypothetical protein
MLLERDAKEQTEMCRLLVWVFFCFVQSPKVSTFPCSLPASSPEIRAFCKRHVESTSELLVLQFFVLIDPTKQLCLPVSRIFPKGICGEMRARVG